MKYSAELERDMKAFYDSLSEKDRRRSAALEAAKLGHGGTDYIATVLGCDPRAYAPGQESSALWVNLACLFFTDRLARDRMLSVA